MRIHAVEEVVEVRAELEYRVVVEEEAELEKNEVEAEEVTVVELKSEIGKLGSGWMYFEKKEARTVEVKL